MLFQKKGQNQTIYDLGMHACDKTIEKKTRKWLSQKLE